MKRTVLVFALVVVLLLSLSAPVFAGVGYVDGPGPNGPNGGNGNGNLLLTRGAKLSKAIQDAKLRNKLSYDIPLWLKVEEVNNHGTLSPFYNEVR